MQGPPVNGKFQCSNCLKIFHSTKDLQKCSRCKLVRYCSKSCQRSAWAMHKQGCRPQDDPLIPSDRDKRNATLSKWTNAWKFSLWNWAMVAMALEGRPKDWLQKNCFFIELEERPGNHPIEQRFSLLGGEVASRQWIVDCLKEDGDNQEQIDDYTNDVRDENVLQIVIKTPHGLLRILWFGLADWEKTRKGKKFTKHILDVIDRYWLDDLADAMDKGDTTAYKNLMKRMVIRQMEEEQAGMRPVYIDSEEADELVREMEEPLPKPDVNPERRAKEAQRRKAKKQRQKERRKAEDVAAISRDTDETVLEEVD